MAPEAARQSSPITTSAAQLVYDDLRRFCEARRSDIASIITRSQFLLVLTSSLYAAYFIARPSPMAFSLLEAIATLVMLPAVVMLLQSGRPLDHLDYVLNFKNLLEEPTEIHTKVILLMEDAAIELSALNARRGRRLRNSYRIWLISLLAAISLLILTYT